VGEVERYAGKPLLRILECYVLHAIGELDVDTQEKLAALSPKLGEVYGRTGDWVAIVSSELSLPDDLPTLIVDSWHQNQRIAREHHVSLTPQRFAEMFVDDNLMAPLHP